MAFLEMADVVKRYGGVRALDGATFGAERGEVHGLLGPNGSGKSTLNKVLAGVVEPNQARISLDGKFISPSSPRAAARHGIAAVYQQLSVIPELTVEQNIVLGTEPGPLGFVSAKRTRATANQVLARFAGALGPDVTATTRVGELSAGEQQIIEICKALARKPDVLVLDEATASLGKHQTEVLFKIVREECERGACVVFVSHRLDEIFELCRRATIIRSGRTVATVEMEQTSESELVALMVGKELGDAGSAEAKPERTFGDPVFSVSGLRTSSIHDVSLQVRAGEIVGLGGLQGQGQSDLLMALFGADKIRSGEIMTGSKVVNISSPARAAKNGFALVPGDRGSQGILDQRPILENISVVSKARRALGRVVLSMKKETSAAQRMVDRLSIKLGYLTDPVSSLSGGNQQKVIIAKWLLAEPTVVLLDDPTKGVDVGAKAEIYALMRELADQGVAVVFNSSEDRELAELADRVLVMYEGRIVEEISEGITTDRLVAAALLIGSAESADDEKEAAK